MCGLNYFHARGSANVSKAIRKHYETQKKRGQEGFGIVAFDMGTKKVHYHHRCETEKEIYEALDGIRDEARKVDGNKTTGILFHHRKPTSTPNIKECAHPIVVINDELEYTYFVAHNGIIHNDDDLKELHEKLGYVYQTELTKSELWELPNGQSYTTPQASQYNDSEALAIEMARYIDGKSPTMSAKGSIAVIVVQCTKDLHVKALYYGRNLMNPLFLDKARDYFSLTSEGSAKDTVEGHKLYRYDYETEITSHTDLTFGLAASYGYGRHTGFDTTRESNGVLGLLPASSTITDLKEETKTTIVRREKEKEEEDPADYSDLTLEEYTETISVLDYSIDNLLMEGGTLEDIEEEILSEMYEVEGLLERETRANNTSSVEWLEKQHEKLGKLSTEVANRIVIENFDEEKANREIEAEDELARGKRDPELDKAISDSMRNAGIEV